MKRRKPRILTLYVTERCQARCSFCRIWEKGNPKDAAPAHFKALLTEARRLFGRIFVDFTGGEPLLYEPLPLLLKQAKEAGLRTSVTTNTKLYRQRAEELKGKIDYLLFSLDGTREYHDQNRGISLYDTVIDSIETARRLGEWPDLLMTVTRENIKMIPHVASIANHYKLIFQINPVFSYFGNTGLTEQDVKMMKEYIAYHKTYVNYAQLRLISRGGNSTLQPSCRAVTSQIVIDPQGRMLLPCYHHALDRLDTEGSLKKAFDSTLRRWYEKRQGTFDFCEGCTINCYFDPSFEYMRNQAALLSLSCRAKYAWLRYVERPIEEAFKNRKRGEL
ncbi:MAG TPA: radical SAM protein [Firmicutes bacterium]|nr:radical SAM protein [Bacillota bacterium]